MKRHKGERRCVRVRLVPVWPALHGPSGLVDRIFLVVVHEAVDRGKCGAVKAVLRIRDVYPASEFSHPGSEFFPTRSRIQIKEIKYFNLENCFRSSRKYDPGWSSQILIFYPSWIPGTGTGSWIRIRNAVWKWRLRLTWPSLDPVEMICIRPDWYRCALGSASASEQEQFFSYSHGSESPILVLLILI